MSNLWLAFLTGLTSGGISCFAVQGGLLTSASSQKKDVVIFLLAKLFAYTLLGFILGFFGAKISLPPPVQGWLQIIIGLYMLATAARLLNLHPIFRYTVIQPPKAVLKLLRNQSQLKSAFTPALLGFLTILIPCGVTQAMLLLAISSGNALSGGLLLFFFVLGTSPVFFLIGIAAAAMLKNKAFSIVAALVILLLGLFSINAGQVLRGSVHTAQNYWRVLTASPSGVVTKTGKLVNLEVTNSGYQADVNTLKVGQTVKLNLISKNVVGCARAFTIPALNISQILPQNGTTTIEITPTQTGNLTYTCSMGMYTGYFNVVE